jgi:hypothetical protein
MEESDTNTQGSGFHTTRARQDSRLPLAASAVGLRRVMAEIKQATG